MDAVNQPSFKGVENFGEKNDGAKKEGYSVNPCGSVSRLPFLRIRGM